MRQIRSFALVYDGLNTVDRFPRGGQVLCITRPMYQEDRPAVSVLCDDEETRTEERSFFVTRSAMPTPGQNFSCGKYVGFAQQAGDQPLHVFEVERAK